jgi:hypothetical protein
MLLGRQVQAEKSAGIRLSAEPLHPNRNQIEGLGDLAYMGWFLATILPRLGQARMEGPDDWRVLTQASSYAQLLGSRHMVNLIAWCAAEHAEAADTTYSKLMCLVARMPGGDVKLHTLYPYLADESHLGYYAASRLGVEAYKRGDLPPLEKAIERVTRFGPDSLEYCDPTLELLILKACREKLASGTVNLVNLMSRLCSLDPLWRRVYELDIAHLFLVDTDPQTIGMLVKGFGLLQNHAAPSFTD